MYSSPNDLRLLAPEKDLVQLASDGRIGQWADPPVQAVLNEAIDQADGEIDAYISLAVELPLNYTPKIISNLSSKIAVYNLYRRRATVPDHWRSEYDRCLALLDRIASGKMILPDEVGKDGAVDDAAVDPGRIVVVNSKRHNWPYTCEE